MGDQVEGGDVLNLLEVDDREAPAQVGADGHQHARQVALLGGGSGRRGLCHRGQKCRKSLPRPISGRGESDAAARSRGLLEGADQDALLLLDGQVLLGAETALGGVVLPFRPDMESAAVEGLNLPDAPEPEAVILVAPGVLDLMLAQIRLHQLNGAGREVVAAVEEEAADAVVAVAGDAAGEELQAQAHPLAAQALLNPESDPRPAGKARIRLEEDRAIMRLLMRGAALRIMA